MLKEALQKIILDKRKEEAPDFVIKNYLREYLQYPVLEFIYGHRDYKNLILGGGSCLRICFGAPRLSEDLDFDLLKKDLANFNLGMLGAAIKEYFQKKYLQKIILKKQGGSRLYLKFPVLRELGFAASPASDFLYVKIEPRPAPFLNPKIELSPVSRFGCNFVAKNYSLPFLMTGKLNAIFKREWFKGKRNEINIKGRDFYDLYWFLEKKIEPDYQNLNRLNKIGRPRDLRRELWDLIDKNVTRQKLSYDLKNFFPNQAFVSDFCKNYKEIIKKYLRP